MRKLFVSLLLGAASLLWSAQGMEKPFYEKARPERRIQIGTQEYLQLSEEKTILKLLSMPEHIKAPVLRRKSCSIFFPVCWLFPSRLSLSRQKGKYR